MDNKIYNLCLNYVLLIKHFTSLFVLVGSQLIHFKLLQVVYSVTGILAESRVCVCADGCVFISCFVMTLN